MRRFAVLFAAGAVALEKVPLKRQGTTTRRRLSVGGRTDLKTCEDNVFYAEASLGTPPQTFHQVGVRNPMADDREKGFSDVNLGV